MNTLDKLYLRAQIRAGIIKNDIKKFMTEEHGVSNVVATIILLLIVVLIVGIFWGRLKEWLEKLMNKIFSADLDTSGMTEAGAAGGGEGN